jgi:predicted transcriptional regulator
MAKLNQIIAIEKGIRSRTEQAITQIYHIFQKPALFNGFTRSYEKTYEDSEDYPSETTKVQATVSGMLDKLETQMSELFDIVAKKEWSNTVAAADVVVNGQTILTQVPVTYLLFLEKQLIDLRTNLANLPILDPAVTWMKNEADGSWISEPRRTVKTKKVQRPIVLYEATKEHPAQVQLITEDMIVGNWNQRLNSGAVRLSDRDQLLERVNVLIDAVKEAREKANDYEAVEINGIGSKIFSFLLEW